MFRLIPLAMAIGIGVWTANVCAATQADEAVAATKDLYARLNASDAARFALYIPADGFTEYNTDSDKLTTLTMAYFNGVMRSGAKIELQPVDLRVQEVGGAAVVTGYREGTVTPPGGRPIASRQSMTLVWSKDDGQWKLHHVHLAATAAAAR